MYAKVLVTLENSPSDRAVIDHMKLLAPLCGSTLTLLHVATSVPAQIHRQDASGEEITEDLAFLNTVEAEFQQAGIPAKAALTYGDPVTEIVKWVETHPCDLVAMSTHGHKLLADLVLGATASKVRHNVTVPVLLVRAK